MNEREAAMVDALQDAVAFMDSVVGLEIEAIRVTRDRWAGVLESLGYPATKPPLH